MTRAEAGHQGGLETVRRHGREHMQAIGRRGGRPTWQEALAKAQAQQRGDRSIRREVCPTARRTPRFQNDTTEGLKRRDRVRSMSGPDDLAAVDNSSQQH